MDFIGPLFLFCGWHILILAIGIGIGYSRPWRWRIVRPEDSLAVGTDRPRNSRQPAYLEENEVFNLK